MKNKGKPLDKHGRMERTKRKELNEHKAKETRMRISRRRKKMAKRIREKY